MITLPKGALIIFEGVDGSGKTSQQDIAYKTLTDLQFDVIKTKEPTEGVWGNKIKQSAQTGRMSPKEELHAFMEDRKENINKVIRPALQYGKIILQDRYYLSSAAYQSYRGLDLKKIMKDNEAFAPEPDLCLLLDIDSNTAFDRIIKRNGKKDLFEKVEELKVIAENFRSIDRDYIVKLKGELPIKDLSKLIIRAILVRCIMSQLPLITDVDKCKTVFQMCMKALVDSYF